MRIVQAGRPQSNLQSVTTACWQSRQIIVYISGTSIVILDEPHHLLQTLYLDSSEPLLSVALDELSGKIAASSCNLVHVYKQDHFFQGEPRWSLQCQLPAADNDTIRTLSWGLDEELLVGSNILSLFSTHNAAEHLWSKSLANPVKFASISYDTSLIATTAQYDRMVKIWKPLSSADQRFDFDYLKHPAVVTSLFWRRPFHRDQSFENILYTIAADNVLRIWAPGDSTSHRILQLWAEVDLIDAIQPRHLEDKSEIRFAFMIHSRDFTVATEKAVLQSKDPASLLLHHLIQVANRSPEILVILDDKGNMSAWGIENIGSKIRTPGDVFNVAHVEDLKIFFNSAAAPIEKMVQIHPFCCDSPERPFSLLFHHFDGRLEWYDANLDQFFSHKPQDVRMSRQCIWTGHSSPIKKVIRSATGKALFSRTQSNESLIWKQTSKSSGTSVRRSSRIDTKDHIHRAWVLQDGNFVVLLHYDCVSLWDARKFEAVEVSRLPYSLHGKPLCLLYIPEVRSDSGLVHLATISSTLKGVSWEVKLPSISNPDGPATIEEFGTFDLEMDEEVSFVLSVDPAGIQPVLSGFLDTSARDVALAYTPSGNLITWTVRPDLEKRKLDWLVTSSTETCIENPYLASGTSIRKAALVNSTQNQLTIWSTKGESLEYEETFNKTYGVIQDLDWSSTPDNQSILSVGFPHKVKIYSQLRYDYIDSRPSWASLREIDALEFTTHPIGDSVWLSGGSFAIGAGNQMFIFDGQTPVSETLRADIRLKATKNPELDIFTLVNRLNGPLPVYHPQYLAHFILGGKILLVQQILIKLGKTLKFYTDGDPFDTMLGLNIEDISDDNHHHNNSYGASHNAHSFVDFQDGDIETITEEVAIDLSSLLSTRTVPLLSSREQFLLVDTLECVATVEKYRRSMDDNGCRFLLYLRQHSLRESQHLKESSSLSWREIMWAYFSTSQDLLCDLAIKHYNGKLLWNNARDCGIFMWLTDVPAVKTQFEAIARNEYTAGEDRDPVRCSLFYLALKKKTVLSGLWRIAVGHGEQKMTQRFLSNDFNEDRWKTAALKNAYALMGKGRFAYAAAFFLLGEDLKAAVGVLSNQLQDIQLAIAVARVYEGDDGPVLKDFLWNTVLPQATTDNNRWMASWALWMLKKRDKAVQALVLPLPTVLSPPETPKLDAKLFSTNDPALVFLYQQLRDKSLQTLKGALSISPKAEWQFLTHTTRLYTRMGCDLIALDLVRSWEFLSIPETEQLPIRQPVSPMLHSFELDPRKLLRRRSSLVIDDLTADLKRPSVDRHATEDDERIEEEQETNETSGIKSHVSEKKPTLLDEPDSNALLDAFGF